MNHSDWVTATGTSYVGLGGNFRRPPNPKLLPHLVAKARQSRAFTRNMRRTILRVAELTSEIDRALAPGASQRRAIRDASIFEQSVPGIAGVEAQLRHWAAVQRARKSF